MKIWLLLILLLPLGVVAREPARGTMNRATAAINVDGVLDEIDWAQAPLLGEIIQREPKQGVAAPEKTEVKLLFDKDSFYVGVTCYDSEPHKIVATAMARPKHGVVWQLLFGAINTVRSRVHLSARAACANRPDD